MEKYDPTNFRSPQDNIFLTLSEKKIIVCNSRFSGPIICFNSAMLTVEYRAQYV